MDKSERNRRVFDYLVLFLLMVGSFQLIWALVTEGYSVSWRNVVALVVLPVNILLFMRNHRAGVLFLGLVLIAGFWGLLSYEAGITRTDLEFSFNGLSVQLQAQPVYALLFLLYFILSFRHFRGILSRGYWQGGGK